MSSIYENKLAKMDSKTLVEELIDVAGERQYEEMEGYDDLYLSELVNKLALLKQEVIGRLESFEEQLLGDDA